MKRARRIDPPPRAAAARDSAAAQLPEGRARQALKLALRVLDLAGVFKRPHDMAQALAQVARALKALDAHPSAEVYLEQALQWAACVPGADLRLDLLCELSELCCTLAEQQRDHAEHDRHAGMAARDRARTRALEVATHARRSSDAQWEARLLLRASDVLDRCGDHDNATSLQHRAVELLGLASADDANPALDATPQAAWDHRLLAPSSSSLM